MDYNSFRVSAVWNSGETVDNDMVYEVGEEAVEKELAEARAWFGERHPESYMISYYQNGEYVFSEYVEA